MAGVVSDNRLNAILAAQVPQVPMVLEASKDPRYAAAQKIGMFGGDVVWGAVAPGAVVKTIGYAAETVTAARTMVGASEALVGEAAERAALLRGPLGSTVNAVDTVQARLQELIAEGHGVQRHGARVTGAQLEGRAVEGLDPMTGTQVDGVHGGTHQYAQHATQIISDEAYVFAESYGRSSQQFIDATTASTTGRAQLEIPLREIYGDDFRDFVSGVTRYGPKAAPTGFGNTIFGDDAYMIIRYKQNSSGTWEFNTMFPQPE